MYVYVYTTCHGRLSFTVTCQQGSIVLCVPCALCVCVCACVYTEGYE